MDNVQNIASKLGLTGFVVHIRKEYKDTDIKILSMFTVVGVITYLVILLSLGWLLEDTSKQYGQNLLDGTFLVFALILFFSTDTISRRFGHPKKRREVQEEH